MSHFNKKYLKKMNPGSVLVDNNVQDNIIEDLDKKLLNNSYVVTFVIYFNFIYIKRKLNLP